MNQPELPEGYARVQCISENRPWVDWLDKELKPVLDADKNPSYRPLALDEVAVVPRNAALDRMKSRRLVVEIR